MSQTYSMCEISENNGKSGKPVWIIVKNVVYDVTKLLKEVTTAKLFLCMTSHLGTMESVLLAELYCTQN